jgi:hypothetical protein
MDRTGVTHFHAGKTSLSGWNPASKYRDPIVPTMGAHAGETNQAGVTRAYLLRHGKVTVSSHFDCKLRARVRAVKPGFYVPQF